MHMVQKDQKQANNQPISPDHTFCPVQLALKMFGGKWKLVILWHLAAHDVIRYGELKKSIPDITHKMLSQELKDLEHYGLINRKEYHQIPPKVEYSLAEKGHRLIPVLEQIGDWAKENIVQDGLEPGAESICLEP
jgi:DNA-binding HxlR family transcriptional regulator